MELLIGLIGALVGIGLFIAGFFLGKSQAKPWRPADITPMSDDEAEKIRAERERMIADQQAFRQLMNYGVEQAYGISGGLKNSKDLPE